MGKLDFKVKRLAIMKNEYFMVMQNLKATSFGRCAWHGYDLDL